MARRGSAIEIEITEGAIRVRSHGRTLTLANAPHRNEDDVEDADFLVYLDEIDHWDPPHDEQPVELEELQKILDQIEDEVEKRGLSVAFE